MARDSSKGLFSFEAGLILVFGAVLAWGWLSTGPSNQELLANYAKAKDLANLIAENQGLAWWSPNYLGGAPTAPLAGTALTMFWIWLAGLFGDPVVGGKIMGFLALLISGVFMWAFVTRLTENSRAGWIAAFFYALGPQAALRLAGNEHLPHVFSMPYPPLIGWALLELATRNSGKGIFVLAVAVSAMSLTYNKLAAIFGPIVLGMAIWFHYRYPAKTVPLIKGGLMAAGLWLVLAVLPQLPGLRETGRMTLFSTDPLVGWQSSFSIKAPLSWLDRGGFLFQGMPPNFTVEDGGFYWGLVVAAAVAIALECRRRGHPSMLDGPIRIFLGLFLFTHWLSLGPRSGLEGIAEFLKSAQGLQDWVLPVFWMTALAPVVLLALIWPEGRWRWPTLVVGLAVYLLVPGFKLYEMIPLIGTVRGPWTFWQVGGAFSLAAVAGLAVARLCPGKTWPWIPVTVLILAALDYSPYYARFFQTRLEVGTYTAFQQAAEFLKNQPNTGSVLPLSGRYFYLQLPQLTDRPISTEAFQSYFMSKGMRSLQDGGGATADLMKISLSVQGVRYILIDRKDVDTPEQLQTAFKQQYPLVYENEFFTVLENPNSLAPGFFARNYASIPKDSYAYSAADLGLIRLYFLPVELAGVEMNDPALAGMMNAQNGEVELTPSFRDREGEPFRILDANSFRREGPNQMRIRLPGEPFWVAVTQAWHPDWKARIDGQLVEVNRATLALPSFRAPGGSREATLTFEPPFWVSAVLSLGLLGWIGGLGGAAYLRFGPAPSSWKKWWEGDELETQSKEVKPSIRKKEQKVQEVTSKIQKFLVMLAADNHEADIVLKMLNEVQTKVPESEILVIDTGSPGSSLGAIKAAPQFGKKIYLLDPSRKSTLSSLYQAGVRWAMRRGYDAVVVLDVGLSYDPEDIPKLLQALSEGADCAVGSRYLNGVRVLHWPQSRLWMSLCGAMGVRMLTGLPLTDPASRFHAIRRRVFEGLDWDHGIGPDSDSPIEIYLRAWQAGYRVQEVPIVFTGREEGQSKVSLLMARDSAWRVLQLTVRRVFP